MFVYLIKRRREVLRAPILLFFILALHFFWAWQWPILNDESYYWDWSRDLQLSYVDAPPAVAWVSFLSSHLFSGNFSVRFLVPFLNCFTVLFILKSAHLLDLLHKFREIARNEEYVQADISTLVIILFTCIPIFNISGVLLVPDAPLLLGCAGTLYFALKACEKFILQRSDALSLKYGFFLGCFLGLGIVSKYQGIPLALGIFFAIVCLRGLKTTFKKDVLFWVITILSAFLISSPVFIWNILNNFASFKFQGQHGFLSWKLNARHFPIYMLGTMGILLPWYFYLFIKQIIFSLNKKNILNSIDIIPLFAFFSIFLFIASASLGKQSRIHWITPSFLFLIPLVASNWKILTKNYQRFWKNIHIISAGLIILIFSVAFTTPFQKFLAQNRSIFGYHTKNLQNGLYTGIIWSGLEDVESNISKQFPQLFYTKNYISNLDPKCSEEPYFATLHWRWASQFAFYFKNNPRVFSLDLLSTSYYAWRDPLQLIAGCRIFIISEINMYKESELKKIMDIQSKREFKIKKRYTNENINMILIEGVMKNSAPLYIISSNMLKNARY